MLGVLNRLGELRPDLFDRLQCEDRSYAKAEFSAYLHFALAAFPNVVNPPWGGSISGYCQSLPYQWSVSSSFQLAVPTFYYGPQDRAPEAIRRSHRVIFSDNPLNPLWWTTQHDASPSARPEQGLLYLRPPGEPIVAVVVGGDVLATTLQGLRPTNIDEQTVGALLDVARHFHLHYGSALLFRDGDKLTFGSMMADVDLSQLANQHAEAFLDRLAAAVSGQ